MNKQTKRKLGKIIKTGLSGILILVALAVMVAANIYMPKYSMMLNGVLGTGQTIEASRHENKSLDLDYNNSDYSEAEMADAEKALNEKITGEGIVMLKNDGYMPYDKDTTFSFFGHSSVDFMNGSFTLSSGLDLKTAFESEEFKVNEKLWKFYSEGKGSNYGLGEGSINFGDGEDFSINECPLSVIKEESNLTDTFDGTTAVFVLQRVNGEGRDLPRSMYNHADNVEDQKKSYLEPNSTELELLDYLNTNFDDVVLVVNSSAAMELGWTKDYENINTILYAPHVGKYGLNALADVFSGETNPSGRLVDTFAYDALSSPASQNYGSFKYYTEDGEETKYNYVSYKEGIYVGYKYYETRYEDKVLGQGNAGDYDYSSEVLYPFGYGLSFTDFKWSDYQTKWSETTCTVTVEVENTGDTAGKDVVQIYAQSPYTEYDRKNSIEKPSVELVGYTKTSFLEPGESETVTVRFDQEQLKSYDYTNAETYILDAGDYYITAAKDAHTAVNNILAEKGKTTADGMTEDGKVEFVDIYTPDISEVDTTTYAVDSYSGVEVSNKFGDANGDLTYLSRSDWVGTWPETDGKVSDQINTWGNEINGEDEEGNPASYTYYKTISDEDLAKLTSFKSGTLVDESSFDDKIVYNEDNGLSLIEMRGRDYDDPLWDDLLDQLNPNDYQEMINFSGYGTSALDSVDKPYCVDFDNVAGIMIGGTGMTYQAPMVLAQTWNERLSRTFGEMIGNEANIGGVSGWYAPAMNIHRTPFSGRNNEYYSEDAFLSGSMAAASVKGASSKGVYTFIKHFVLNDQENHRGDLKGQHGVCTWSNEQAIREAYLKPFEMCMKSGDISLEYVKKNENGEYINAEKEIRASQALMTAFNRIGYTWAGGHYNLLTGVLRNEWGFNGFVITDNANTNPYMNSFQMLSAGGDAVLTNEGPQTYEPHNFNKDSVADYHYGRQAIHNILYTVANSKAMDGAMPGSNFKLGMPTYQKIQIAVNVVCLILIILLVYFIIKRHRNSKDNK